MTNIIFALLGLLIIGLGIFVVGACAIGMAMGWVEMAQDVDRQLEKMIK